MQKKYHQVGVRLPEESFLQIAKMSGDMNISKGEVAKRLIQKSLQSSHPLVELIESEGMNINGVRISTVDGLFNYLTQLINEGN